MDFIRPKEHKTFFSIPFAHLAILARYNIGLAQTKNYLSIASRDTSLELSFALEIQYATVFLQQVLYRFTDVVAQAVVAITATFTMTLILLIHQYHNMLT